MSVVSILRRWHFMNPFGLREASEAEIDNVLRDHDAAMSRISASDDGARESQGSLRKSIEYARSSSASVQGRPDAIAQFVHDMRSSGRHQERG